MSFTFFDQPLTLLTVAVAVYFLLRHFSREEAPGCSLKVESKEPVVLVGAGLAKGLKKLRHK